MKQSDSFRLSKRASHMADRDWDLSAIVRNWAPAAASPPTGPTAAAANGEHPKAPACLVTLTFQKEEEEEDIGGQGFPFGFPDLVEEPRSSCFEELQQLYRPFLPRPKNSSPSFTGEVLPVNPTCVPRRITSTPPHNHSVVPQEQSTLQHGRQQRVLHMSHRYQQEPPAQPPRTRKR